METACEILQGQSLDVSPQYIESLITPDYGSLLDYLIAIEPQQSLRVAALKRGLDVSQLQGLEFYYCTYFWSLLYFGHENEAGYLIERADLSGSSAIKSLSSYFEAVKVKDYRAIYHPSLYENGSKLNLLVQSFVDKYRSQMYDIIRLRFSCISLARLRDFLGYAIEELSDEQLLSLLNSKNEVWSSNGADFVNILHKPSAEKGTVRKDRLEKLVEISEFLQQQSYV